MSSSSSQPSEKRMRAIDRLDQHMMKRSMKNSKSSSPSGPFLPWLSHKLPSNSQSGSNGNQNHEIGSPSPKRRKIASLSPTRNVEPTINGHSNTFPIEARVPTSVQSSPIKKTVAFSDRIESSPTQQTPRSSPRPSSLQKPVKSILRNADTLRKCVSDISFKRPPFLSQNVDGNKIERAAGIDPHRLDFWVGGEVHSMLDPYNVHEFFNIIDGGLRILSRKTAECTVKRFEIYATFNNIMPSSSAKGLNDVTDRKMNVLIDQMELIVNVCLPHLKEEQQKLLSTGEKKDPFSSRLYVQIVRFFNFILSNFKLLKWLTSKPHLQKNLKSIYELSLEALTHDNTNKVIVAAQVAFLGDSKFGTFFLNNDEITSIIRIIPSIKEIQSANLINEKLILIKNFIAKHPRLMIDHVSIWFCGEVIPRILIENELNSTKIVATAVSIALDLLKKCIDFSKGHEEIFKCVESLSVNDVVPKKLLTRFTPSQDDNHDSIAQQSLGQLLRKQIRYLIIAKQEYKLAMDLWLALTGLLYNNTDRLEYLGTHVDDEWLNLNLLCFETSSAQAKLLSLKVWRVLTYSICTHLEDETIKNIKIVSLLQRPFEFAQQEQYDFNVMEGLIFHLTGIIYTAFNGHNTMSSGKFLLLWDHAVKPIYTRRIFPSTSIQLKNRATVLLLRLLGGKIMEQQLNMQHQQEKQQTHLHKNISKNGVHPIRVIASAGVSARDIQPLSANVIGANFATIKDLIFEAIKSDSSNLSQNVELITALLKHMPGKLINEDCLWEFVKIIHDILIQRKDDKNVEIYFVQITCSLVSQFTPLLFEKQNNFEAYLRKFEFIFSINPDTKVKLLKELIIGLRGKLPEFFLIESFLEPQNLSIRKYVSNWIGSMLLSPSIPYEHFCSLVRIVNAVPTTEVLQNFLDLASKVPFKVDLFQSLSLKNWDEKELTLFLKNSIIKNLKPNRPVLYSFMENILRDNEKLFSTLLPLLCQFGHYEILRHVLIHCPNFLRHTLEVDEDSFNQILPLESLPFILKDFLNYETRLQLRIIRWTLQHKQSKILFENPSTLQKSLFQKNTSPEDTVEKDKLLLDLLSYMVRGKESNYLSLLVTWCLENNNIGHLTTSFSKDNLMPLLYLSPQALALMVNKCGSLNPTLIEAIKRSFIANNTQFNISLIEELIVLKKFQLFILCGKEIVTFFLDNSSSLSAVERDGVLSIFERLLISLMGQKKSLVLDFVEEISKKLPEEPDIYLLKIITILAEQLQVNGKKLKKETRFRQALQRLVELEHNGIANHPNEAHYENQEGATKTQFSGEYVQTPKGFNDLKISDTPNEKIQEINEVQVYATQERRTFQNEPVKSPHQNEDHTSLVSSEPSTKKKNKKNPEETVFDTRPTRGLSSEDAIEVVDLKSNFRRENSDVHPPDTLADNLETQPSTRDGKGSFLNGNGNAPLPYDAVRDFRNHVNDESGDHVFSRILGATEFPTIPKNEEHGMKHVRDEKSDNLEERSQTVKEHDAMTSVENKEGSQIVGIRIPIFNSSKLPNKAKSKDSFHDNGFSERQHKRVDDNDNENGNEYDGQKFENTKDRDLISTQPEDFASSQDNESTFLQDSRRPDWESQNSAPSLRLHFPTRKSRKLVSRLRGFSLEDISRLSPEEKRNLRIELLDFMMKLEHESLAGEF
ncbi:hypothetical protein ZYGR_0AG03860 [Zygosaccharomyces rouxii]|uniref:Telomere-associated protein Rif1 N-terminal domain-containing protein n=1 Tax=Zygosaccharomyces rouxii TaxID=4956 RepID=A0A1Q3A9M4_ZYGRO|nr:hypothetical protein ZYGR_0AG03860 [Zygosaccharomyces rouxii]